MVQVSFAVFFEPTITQPLGFHLEPTMNQPEKPY